MATFRSFQELDSWNLARELVREIYYISRTTELHKDYGLKDQIQRSSVSIMSNIAEGFERNSRKEFIRFLNIARGSSAEVKSQLYVLLDIGYIDEKTFNKLYKKTSYISKTLLGLINYLIKK
ncbi:four helix bundle protein [Paramaledivibacter caminithermalis]|jgi:four helix bundle protein|uniref:Four helix bundle protein n=1 Tax=Paramaledivibacter caminithermalis (strain DSM 15212 / CIP 107654 / DViRD3) TaxID=1121301 RepID=A0A1M6L5J5_PARC5|nr:four helix bundle protein [Paramaledivibacter caminithermalis]SHJ66486.1 four helix bundle protein [Paramaledivibacter caminithermalis DSM 15212]